MNDDPPADWRADKPATAAHIRYESLSRSVTHSYTLAMGLIVVALGLAIIEEAALSLLFMGFTAVLCSFAKAQERRGINHRLWTKMFRKDAITKEELHEVVFE